MSTRFWHSTDPVRDLVAEVDILEYLSRELGARVSGALQFDFSAVAGDPVAEEAERRLRSLALRQPTTSDERVDLEEAALGDDRHAVVGRLLQQ